MVDEAIRAGAIIGAVNASEVIAKLDEGGMSAADIEEAIESLGLEIIPFDEEQAYRAGLLRSVTRAAGLSLGDRACLALAGHLDLPVLTADRAWAALPLALDVRVIR
jgi:PIN domain nuclease of toxin-antitoxin system